MKLVRVKEAAEGRYVYTKPGATGLKRAGREKILWIRHAGGAGADPLFATISDDHYEIVDINVNEYLGAVYHGNVPLEVREWQELDMTTSNNEVHKEYEDEVL